jgi:hypothetical protein
MRSAASHGIRDIIAIGLKDIVPCQVKTGDWPGTADSDALELFPAPANARKVDLSFASPPAKAKNKGNLNR